MRWGKDKESINRHKPYTWAGSCHVYVASVRARGFACLTTRQITQTITTILWLTFAGIALCNIWTFALAYYCSTHKPGTTKDADFWFLLQGCITQCFGLAISCLPLLKEPLLPRWSWMPPMVFALLCTVLAPPLYVTLPTEWSSFRVVLFGQQKPYSLRHQPE
jgi:hypothetical protein